MRRLLFDIEANGLLLEVTKVHCIAAGDPDTGERLDWGPDNIQDALAAMSTADVLVAHYGLGYDFPALKKLYGFEVPEDRQRDSVVIAKLIYPDIKRTDGDLVKNGTLDKDLHGSHKLKAWGQRVGVRKGDYDGGWETWTPEMHDYMVQDITTLLAIWKHLAPDEYSQSAIELEHRVQRLVARMEAAGVPFDVKAAGAFHAELLGRQSRIERELVAEFGEWQEVDRVFVPKRDNKRLGYTAGVEVTKYKTVTFNPSSRQHIVKKLKELGWKPSEFTANGSPKLSDEILEAMFENFPQAKSLVEYLLLDKRLGALADGDNAWLKKVHADGRIHGVINPMGTPHSRASHYSPNMAQVPASKSPYGKECRALFGVPDGWSMVGADMSGLQLRGLAHYLHPLDGGAYSKIVCEGDPHWKHAEAFGLIPAGTVRDKSSELHEVIREMGAKRLGYARIFGCFPPKAGSVIRETYAAARARGFPELYEKRFGRRQTNSEVGVLALKGFDSTLKLDKLQTKLGNIAKRLGKNANVAPRFKGHIPGIDGRWVPVRSDHSMLNFLLSSSEAVLCKAWICDAFDELIRRGFRHGWDGDFVFLLWVHDEVQVAARCAISEEVGQVLTVCAKTAGEKLGFRVPIKSEFKIGQNWADTH